ncbi:MAG: hypothetical protein Tsb0014_04030 [Pleurocapsa sp.]
MLKITYTDNGLHLEYLTESLEEWIAKRILVNLRAATSIYIEPSTACLVLPANLPYFQNLEALEAESDKIELTNCDEDYVEVAFQGTWVSSQKDSEEGIFVCDLADSTEFFLFKLWQESQLGASVISE